MIEEFDKEIDSLLRQTARSETAVVADTAAAPHLDADEISLFAENALTTKARTRAVGHLAECVKCRKILSNVISLNAAETESENVHAIAAVAAPKIEGESSSVSIASPVIPWYRRLFAFPQITYAMGALALIFTGIIAAVIVTQNASQNEISTIAQSSNTYSEKSRGGGGGGGGGASSDGETQSSETFLSSAAAPNSNTAANTSAIAANPNAAMNEVKSAETSPYGASTNSTTSAGTVNSPAAPSVLSTPPPEEKRKEQLAQEQENSFVLDGVESKTSPSAPQNKPNITAGATLPPPSPKDNSQNLQTADLAKNEPREDRQRVNRDKKTLSETQNVATTRRDDEDAQQQTRPVAKKSGQPQGFGEMRNVRGRNFRRTSDGVWIDTDYSSQPQTAIRRGTDEYKRLDSKLRSITENLGGTVIVVWKGRAYRIQ